MSIPGLAEILRTSNQTAAAYPQLPLHGLFEARAAMQSNHEAVRFRNSAMSYSQLNGQANRIAHYLIRHGVTVGERIGVLIDRSEYLPVLLLAILKTGAAYVPFDTEYPAARINYMLENSGAVKLLTQEKYKGRFQHATTEFLLEELIRKTAGESAINPGIATAPHDLAYILYTSGSTGQPKGVMVEHGSVVNLLSHLHEKNIIQSTDRLLAITTIAFDIAVLEMFLPLLAGAVLVITDSQVSRDGAALLRLLAAEQITIMQATPVTWKIMLAAGWLQKLPLTVLCCGEALPLELAKKILPLCRRLYNYYGPTETTIYSTGTEITPTDTRITIGKPVANTQVYILNETLNEVTGEEEGELYIGGDGVARGYVNLPQLTAERFVESTRGRRFRTGDIGKWTADGDILLFGRADHQIKIRGFRIEPGEIETILLSEPDIQDAVVIAREDTPGHKTLVAYVVAVNITNDAMARWKRRLQDTLPDYMVPHAYVVMDQLPLTPNGKTDRNALPKPAGRHHLPAASQQHVLTDTEKKVKAIWEAVLEKDNAGVDEDFFDSGGHSLVAVEMMCRLEEQTGRQLPIAVLFEAPTIRLLSRFIDSGNISAVWESLVPVKTSGSRPPLYIVHGDGLNVMVFHSMVRHLHPDQPVFGLQPKGMNGEEEPDESIEEMAAYYISGILKENPKGPYLLAGYSFGGIVAFEMAKQLQRAGREVKLLAMFDTNAGNIDYTGPLWQRVAKRLLLQFPKMLFILKSLGKYPGIMLRYQAHVVKRKWTGFLSRLGLAENAETELLSENEKRIFEKNREAYHRYALTPYTGRIDLFRVQQRVYFIDDPVYLGWKDLADKGVTIHDVPGDHHTFLTPPYDRIFANTLQQLIDKRLSENKS